MISHNITSTPDINVDDWIAVAFSRDWYPGQFVSYDDETGEVCVNFLHRSATNSKWFIWPALSGQEDKSWINEGNNFKIKLAI